MNDSQPTDSIALLRNGSEAFPAWLEAIGSASEEILFEMYWFASDHTGRKFARALSDRASAGVEVFVIYDSVGSFGSDPAMFEAMVAAGCRVIEFHPIAPWRRRFRFDRVTLRDHRKILVVDRSLAFAGGLNVCDQSAPREEGGGGWRDDTVRIEGAAALEMRALFFDTWLRLGGPAPRHQGSVARRARRQLVAAARVQAGATIPPSSLKERISRISQQVLPVVSGDIVPTPPRQLRYPAPAVQVFGHAAWGAQRTIRNLYVRQIRSARERILIANSYFVPDNSVRHALERAARRGVEVRVIVPADSDVPSVAYAARALYARLMRAGVHIHEWIEGMMHAKTAVIDAWATVGSYNLDYRSLRYNLEVNIASRHPPFVSQVEHSVRTDLALSREINPAAWARRPWVQKVLEWVHYLLRKLL